MKNATFTFEYIEPGTRIVYLTPTGIKEGLITAVKPILPFDIRLHEETLLTIDYCVQVSEPLKPLYDEWLDLNSVIYAEDFDALIDILSNRYYLLRPQQPKVKQQKAQQQPVLNPGSDEEIARRTTYLCSDGKFYTITNYPQADNEGYTYQGVGNWVINQLDLDGYDLFIEAENTLFNHCGCEVCRIIEDDKGRFIIQDRTCESSGFIFMDLKSAKLAAWWLMEEEVIEIGESLIDAAEQAAVGMKTAVDIMNSSDPSNGYREVWMCKNGDLYYMCAAIEGKESMSSRTFAIYQLWAYPKGETTEPVLTSSTNVDIEQYMWNTMDAEYHLSFNNNQYPAQWEVRIKDGFMVGMHYNIHTAIDETNKLRRDTHYDQSVKDHTQITFPGDNGVYIIADGRMFYAHRIFNGEWTMFPYPKGGEGLDNTWVNTLDEVETWLDKNYTIKYIIRSTDSEKPEFKAFIGRTAETTGFVFTDKDTAVKSTLEVNMGITSKTELEATLTNNKIAPEVIVNTAIETADIPEEEKQQLKNLVAKDGVTASGSFFDDADFCSTTRQKLITAEILISVVYITKQGNACFVVQKDNFYRIWEFVNDDRNYIQHSMTSIASYEKAVQTLEEWYGILYEIKMVFGAWRICKPGTETYIKVPGSISLKETVDIALKYTAGSKTDK